MTPAMMQFILLALQSAPQLISLASAELAALRGEMTDEQTAQIDAALAAAHAELQGAQPASGPLG